MRPTLLAVCTLPPWPVRDGYALRVAGLLRGLGREWDITLVSPLAPGGGLPPGVARHVPVALRGTGLTYPWRFDPAPLRAALLSAGPHARGLVWPGAEAAWPCAMPTVTGVSDVVHVSAVTDVPRVMDMPAVTGVPAVMDMPAIMDMPAVMDMIDCNPLELWRTARAPGDARIRLRALRELPVSLRWARHAVRGFMATACVGADDAAWMARIGGRPVPVIPNGVDLPALGTPDAAPTAAFAGTLNYPPNADAVAFLAGAVWPRVRAAVPGARLLVAGRSPGPAVLALHGRDGIEVLPDVPDMAAVLGRAWLGVAPMRTGVGLKNKVLETWAAARPCVLTPLAANGLLMPPGHAGLVAADAAGLAAAMAALLRDRDACLRLGEAARDWVAARFSWAGAAAAVDALLRQGGGGRPSL